METKVQSSNNLLEEICSMPGGEGIRDCIQCGTCTGSCPSADKWDFSVRKTIAMVRAGYGEELLSSNSMWFCLSCYLCTVRCPRDVKPTEVMHAMECVAARRGLSTKRSSTPVMYKAFADSMKNNGRVHELGFMITFYRRKFFSLLTTNPLSAIKMVTLVGMAPRGIGLFSHGRLGLKGAKIKGTKELQAIIKKAEELGGAR
jgi:heterodisulfide reductase subunit C